MKFQGSCFPLVEVRTGEEGSYICSGFIPKQSFQLDPKFSHQSTMLKNQMGTVKEQILHEV